MLYVVVFNNMKEFLTIDDHYDDIKCAPYIGFGTVLARHAMV